MQLRAIMIAGVMFMLCLEPANAQLCAIALDTGGTMALNGDGTILGSEAGLGALPATVLITSLLSTHTIDVSTPTRISAAPAGYDAGSELVEVAYGGLGALAGISHAYTSDATSFDVGALGIVTLNVNNHIINENGFAPGTYTTRTVITCR